MFAGFPMFGLVWCDCCRFAVGLRFGCGCLCLGFGMIGFVSAIWVLDGVIGICIGCFVAAGFGAW